MDPVTGTVIRAGGETVVNPLDLYALEAALRIKEQCGGSVTAVTMGPPQAMRVLKEAVAMGCDDAVLVSDKKFGGSDTHATSYVLAQAIRAIGAAVGAATGAKAGGFDLIVTGERATDGDTAQVGPGIASWLDLPLATYVAKINEIKDGRILAERLVEEGYQILSVPLPCLITVVKEVAPPRLPTLDGKIKSMELPYPVYSTGNMNLNPEYLGLKGSPTRVVSINSPKVMRSGKTITVNDDASLNEAVDEIINLLETKGVLR
jgi:electron transfer flavoprotein beta subunit